MFYLVIYEIKINNAIYLITLVLGQNIVENILEALSWIHIVGTSVHQILLAESAPLARAQAFVSAGLDGLSRLAAVR
jgi:hypothetical protein